MANVKFTINADNSSALTAFNQVKRAVGSLRSSLNDGLKGAVVGAFGTAAVAAAIKKTTEYADNIDEASSRLDVGIEKLQEWTYAAKQSGASMEDLVGFTEKLSGFAQSKNGVLKLQAMGIDPNQGNQQLMQSFAKFAKGKESNELVPILKEIGGRSGGKMFNFFQNDLDEIGAAARRAGAIMDTKTTVTLAALNDQFSILTDIIVSQLGPALVFFGKNLISTWDKTQGFFEKLFTDARAQDKGRERKIAQDAENFNKVAGKINRGGYMRPRKNVPLIPVQASATKDEFSDIDEGNRLKREELDKMLSKLADEARKRGQPKTNRNFPKSMWWENPKFEDDANSASYFKAPSLKEPTSTTSIGNVMGVDAQYRIDQIQHEIRDELRKIRELAEQDARRQAAKDSKTTTSSSDFPEN